jgi:D-aminopeptidase
VHELLRDGTAAALRRLERGAFDAYEADGPARVRIRFASTTHVDILMSVPGVSKVDGFTVAFEAPDMDRAYRLIRLMYRFIQT